MKSPEFDYIKARSLEQALSLLASHGDEARILAGGQSLLAALNMRLSEPALLIDISGLNHLRGIQVTPTALRIGALTTHTDIENSAQVAQHAPLLKLAVPHIAHRAIRNAGTFGGSIANADPAAEWPCCLLALDGQVVAQSPRGERRIAALDFFTGLYTTELADDEVLTACELPLAQRDDWFGFQELARRHGDYAIAGLAMHLRFAGPVVQAAKLSWLGLASTPLRSRKTEQLLVGKPLDATTFEMVVASLREELDPLADLTNSGATKKHLATVLARRLLTQAQATRQSVAA
ncbi:xanthine dehydrogenase family protein subunit M [Limnohabitans sp. JirII-31]|uniref:FAD binding domain-containing protein n=1 Tax=Limnohabitans sp. JirII-31 TaxID=1977908 RepID=UPI000C1F1A9B|nr:xanthine dehydrogenase family protein subunit M [Limnohabitans sp. JirII-31]PIT77389.1 molybdopterin dehydrogenase [Limnohabitans sp. JirII-31]